MLSEWPRGVVLSGTETVSSEGDSWLEYEEEVVQSGGESTGLLPLCCVHRSFPYSEPQFSHL